MKCKIKTRTRIYKNQEYLEKLSYKIPNIKAGLKLTKELSEYVEHRSYGKITSLIISINNYKKINYPRRVVSSKFI